jgi:N-acetyl-anhydromuramyl-L-alanine amidase AmpD
LQISQIIHKADAVIRFAKLLPIMFAGILSGEQCARIFQRASRNASANYCIGVKGDIVCNVEEENRAWTSSNRLNDLQAITIEVSNSKMGGDYPISEASWNSLVNLCVDICQRYNFKLVYDGTPNGSLTRHNMFANTDCPRKISSKKIS